MMLKENQNALSISKIHSFLSAAFTKVKQDMMMVMNWLQYFYQKHQQHDYRLDMIEQQLSDIPKTPHEIKQIIDSYYSYDHILDRIQNINKRLDDIEQKKPEPRAALKERIIKKIAKNSKDYVKNVIVSMIKKYTEISAPQLKEIIVHEQGLCSKSSFYRILEELESDDEIDISKHGKEKIFLYKTAIIK